MTAYGLRRPPVSMPAIAFCQRACASEAWPPRSADAVGVDGWVRVTSADAGLAWPVSSSEGIVNWGARRDAPNVGFGGGGTAGPFSIAVVILLRCALAAAGSRRSSSNRASLLNP